jgi:hypothetical protein
MSKTLFASMIAASMFVVSATGIYAKGSDTISTVKTVAGPCSEEFAFSETGYTSYYPLAHDLGTVGVYMNMLTGTPRVERVCLPAGWTVTGGNVTDGIQLAMSVGGNKAIDFKYVLGKTDIKFR